MGAEREFEGGGAVVLAGKGGPLLDLYADAHVHTGFSIGRDSIGALVTGAERAGLTQLTFADLVTKSTSWLPVYQKSILRAQQRTEVQLRIAAEVELARPDGWLEFPADLAGLDAISIAVTRAPLLSGPADARRVQELLHTGVLRAADLIEQLAEATAHAVERASRYAPTQLARPLNLLWQVGIGEHEMEGPAINHLVETCRVTGTAVEVSEAWRTPSVAVARRFADAGVQLVAASDARDVAQLGQWRYVARVLSALSMGERGAGRAVGVERV